MLKGQSVQEALEVFFPPSEEYDPGSQKGPPCEESLSTQPEEARYTCPLGQVWQADWLAKENDPAAHRGQTRLSSFALYLPAIQGSHAPEVEEVEVEEEEVEEIEDETGMEAVNADAGNGDKINDTVPRPAPVKEAPAAAEEEEATKAEVSPAADGA